jgi:hypothetical protein
LSFFVVVVKKKRIYYIGKKSKNKKANRVGSLNEKNKESGAVKQIRKKSLFSDDALRCSLALHPLHGASSSFPSCVSATIKPN